MAAGDHSQIAREPASFVPIDESGMECESKVVVKLWSGATPTANRASARAGTRGPRAYFLRGMRDRRARSRPRLCGFANASTHDR